jgi:hypothetical protein
MSSELKQVVQIPAFWVSAFVVILFSLHFLWAESANETSLQVEDSKSGFFQEWLGGYILNAVLYITGIYDILCCFSILFLSEIPPFSLLSKLHPTMFAKEADIEHPVLRRLLAYWLVTYGAVRTAAGFSSERQDGLDICAAMTCFFEGIAFAYEAKVGNMVLQKVQFVTASSIVLGVYVLLRPLGVFN